MRFKLALILVAVMIIFTPIMLSAQMITSAQDACKQAKIDASNNVNGNLWTKVGYDGGLFGWGCLIEMFVGEPSIWNAIGIIGGLLCWPILPMIITPSPPSSKLIGMPPEYVAYYTKCYKEAGKRIQFSKARRGCVESALMMAGSTIVAIWFAKKIWCK